MTTNSGRVFEGTYVPMTFENLLVPTGADPDGLGPLSDEHRRLYSEFRKACEGYRAPLKRLAKELYLRQKSQLKNSYVIASKNGEAADNMAIEDICAWLALLGVLTPNNPDYVFDAARPASRYEIATWVFTRCDVEGVYLELSEAVRTWNKAGALESTAYPGDRAIDGDGSYPILVPEEEEAFDLMGLDQGLDLPPEFSKTFGQRPARTQSLSFADYQWPKGHCPNKAGRPRRPRETEPVDESRPHFFECPMPQGLEGNHLSYGDFVYKMAVSCALKDDDQEWLSQMGAWARELAWLRAGRKKFANGGYVYDEDLEVTRIDIAIRHLSLVEIQWRKSPSARWVICPWLLSAALERMKKGSLTRENMEGIYTRTKTPQHVDWPSWWPQDLRCKHSENERLERPRRKISGRRTKP